MARKCGEKKPPSKLRELSRERINIRTNERCSCNFQSVSVLLGLGGFFLPLPPSLRIATTTSTLFPSEFPPRLTGFSSTWLASLFSVEAAAVDLCMAEADTNNPHRYFVFSLPSLTCECAGRLNRNVSFPFQWNPKMSGRRNRWRSKGCVFTEKSIWNKRYVLR